MTKYNDKLLRVYVISEEGKTVKVKPYVDGVKPFQVFQRDMLYEFDDYRLKAFLESDEKKFEDRVKFGNDDHVWIDGMQYISLRRFVEAVQEAGRTKKKTVGEIACDALKAACTLVLKELEHK